MPAGIHYYQKSQIALQLKTANLYSKETQINQKVDLNPKPLISIMSAQSTLEIKFLSHTIKACQQLNS